MENMEVNETVTTPLVNQESTIPAGKNVNSMISMFNSYSASKENRDNPIPRRKFGVDAPGYQSTPLIKKYTDTNRNMKKHKKILAISNLNNITNVTSSPNGNTQEENWNHIDEFKKDQKCDMVDVATSEFMCLSMVVNYNADESRNDLTTDMFTCNNEFNTSDNIEQSAHLEDEKPSNSNCFSAVNPPLTGEEAASDDCTQQDSKASEEASDNYNQDTKSGDPQGPGDENIDIGSISNLTNVSDSSAIQEYSDDGDNDNDLASNKKVPRQDSKEKFYNMLMAISQEYGINSTKDASPILNNYPKTIEEEVIEYSMQNSSNAPKSQVSLMANSECSSPTHHQTTKSRNTNYVTATSVNSPIAAPEITPVKIGYGVDSNPNINCEESPDARSQIDAQRDSPNTMLNSLCDNSVEKANLYEKKRQAMHKHKHQSYRTSTFINPPSLSDCNTSNEESPLAKTINSDINASIMQSAASRPEVRKRFNQCSPQDELSALPETNIGNIKIQLDLVKSPIPEAPTANSEESHVVYEESRYIDNTHMSNLSAGTSILKSSKRYRRLFGKKKNRFGDSVMSTNHNDTSMASNTSILGKRFKKKKKTLAAQQSTKLLMSLHGEELNDQTVQSMTLLAIHDDVAQQKLALAKKYRKVEAEVFQSERTYQRHLRVIIKHFLEPLRNHGYIPDAEIDGIFSNIEQILHVNEELLKRMTRFGIAEAFAALTPFLKLYSLYASNYDRAIHLIVKWEKISEDFASFKKSKESGSIVKGQKLMSLLIMPVQRIPRYKLLLEELLNLSRPGDKDYLKLKQSVEDITKVVEFVNEKIREHQDYDKVIMIQNKFKGNSAPNFVAPGRKLIKEGSLWKVCGKKSKIRMFFLFSDILVYARQAFTFGANNSIRNYECRGILPLSYCSIVEIFGGSENADAGGLVKLTCKGKSFLLYSNDRLEIQGWSKELKNAIRNALESRLSLKKLIVDSDVVRVKKKTTISLPPRRFSLRRKSRTPKRIKEYLSESCMDSLYPMRKELIPHHTPKVARYNRERSKNLETQKSNVKCDANEALLTPSKAVEETLELTHDMSLYVPKKKPEIAQCIII
ncbi:putative protein tag-52 [Trichoplax sp. H2]|nr:putative protein tag-52 [Trichoplax sp. H2]|eukprot:RDD41506.1 putative protein tag-52 [Trichoplax sp. H2]